MPYPTDFQQTNREPTQEELFGACDALAQQLMGMREILDRDDELLDQDELLSTSAPALATLDVSRPAAVKLAKAAANLEEAGGALNRADDEMMSFWKLVFTNDADFLKAGGASGLGSLPDCYLAAHWLCSLCVLALASD